MQLKKAYKFNLSITHIAGRTAFFQGNNIVEGASVKNNAVIPEGNFFTNVPITEEQRNEICDFINDVGSQL